MVPFLLWLAGAIGSKRRLTGVDFPTNNIREIKRASTTLKRRPSPKWHPHTFRRFINGVRGQRREYYNCQRRSRAKAKKW